MVRETRHLWIGNLPENVREEQILEIFQRHGRVQSVKMLSEENSPAHGVRGMSNGGSGHGATVSFIDIRSASKALRAGPTLSGQALQIAYHEPGSLSSRGNSVSIDSSSSPARSASGESVIINSEINVGSGSNNNSPSINLQPSILNPGLGHSNPATLNGPGLNPNSYRPPRFPLQHGPSEDSSSHFYEQSKGFSRGGRGDDHFHGGRGRRENRYLNKNNRQGFNPDRERRFRNNWYSNENRFAPPAHLEPPENERTSSAPPVSNNNNEPGTNSSKGLGRLPDSPVGSVPSRHMPSKRHQSRSVSDSGSSDRGSSAGSRSRSGSPSSISTSASSGRSRSPPQHHGSSGHISRGGVTGSSTGRFHQNSFSRQRYNRSRLVSRPADSSRRRHSHSSRSPPMGGRSRSSSSSSSPSPHRKISTAPQSRSRSPSSTKSYSPSRSLNSSSTHHRHQTQSSKNCRVPSSSELHSAIRIRNLPSRSSDTSLKDGLYHEYKKHGKLAWVRIIGSGPDRHAIVCFKSIDHATRAVSLSQDKHFFGCKIQVTLYQAELGRIGGGEEGLGGGDDDNRLFGDDGLSTNTPSRTVLVTGLDPSITAADLRKTFEQYGDILDVKIRKPLAEGMSCSGIIEFVDIASAVRAQWIRHVFKSRETRVAFFRNPVTNSLLLDGISGVTEKQITGHCCQFGAISRVVTDCARILALVQFEEISSAQTAFRELKNWIQKGRPLHVDFASPACIRLFLDRTLASGNNLSMSPDLRSDSATPPLLSACQTPPTKTRRHGSRKFTDIPMDRRTLFRNIEPELDNRKPVTELLPEGRNIVGEPICEETYNGRRTSRFNGGFDDASVGEEQDQRFDVGLVASASERRVLEVKNATSTSKIDLSCHETDSAIVTSSSDIICADEVTAERGSPPYGTPHHHHGGTTALVAVNGDDHHATYESVGATKSRASYRWTSKSQNVFDGVSSTSPEPKTETVQKVSPDSGIGHGSLVTVEPHLPAIRNESLISPVFVDPRRKTLENKIRRSSADSGNIHCSAFIAVDSNSSGRTSFQASETITPDTPEDLSDDRPGTPLCDENPETFPDTNETTQSKHTLLSVRTTLPPNRSDLPLSLPVPEGINRNTLGEAPRQIRRQTPPKSPVHSPVRGSPHQSPMAVLPEMEASPVPPTVIPLSAATIEKEHSVPADEKSMSSTYSPSSPAKSTNVKVTDNSNGGESLNSSPSELGERTSQTPPSVVANAFALSEKGRNHDDRKGLNSSVSLKEDENLSSNEDDILVSPPSSPDAEKTPRGEEEIELYERLNKLKQVYEEWDKLDNCRTVTRTLSYANTNATDEGNESCGLSNPEKRWLTRSKAIDIDEIRQQPSDITKSLIAKSSIFDEDSKRLESSNDTNLNSASLSDWRLSFATRSTSTPSTSSLASVPLTPSSVSSSVFSPPPSSPSTSSTRTQQYSFPTSSQIQGNGCLVSKSTLANVPIKATSNSTANRCSAPAVAGPFPNSVIKRKDSGIQEGSVVGGSQWALKDPRLSSKAQGQSASKIPIPVSSSSSLHSTPLNSGPSVHRSSTWNANGLVRAGITSKANEDFPKAKHPDETGIDESQKPVLLTQKSAPQPTGFHQGIPRTVERSMSLDCKKQFINSGNNPSQSPSAMSVPADACNSIPASSTTTLSSTRRTSVDSSSSKETPSVSSQGVKEGDYSKAKGFGTEPAKELREILAKPSHSSAINIPPPGNIIESSKSIARFDAIKEKEEIRVNPQHLQHPTVGVVAISHPQTIPPLISSKTASSSNGKEKESNKKDDSIKKNSKSNSSIPSSNPVSSITGSNKGDSSGSNKSSKSKDKKDRSSNGTTNNAAEKSKHENDTSHHGNHQKKAKEKEHEDMAKERRTVNENVNSVSVTPSNSHEQKRDKELKAKRRLSNAESEPESKKIKVEKERSYEKVKEEQSSQQQEIFHQNRAKSSASSTDSLERREPRDLSSCVTKEKKEIQKEKPHSTVKLTDNKTETSTSPVKEKGEKTHKDTHHRSKSTSSSSSKNHYHTTKAEKTSTSSSLHTHTKEKEKQKTEKVSPSGGKDRENKLASSSSSSKHSSSHSHTSSSSSHHRKSEKEDKATSSSSKRKSREKEKAKNSSIHFGSEEESIDGSRKKNEKQRPTNLSNKEKGESGSSGSNKGRRDRQKSGGDSSSAQGDSVKAGISGKNTKEKKKRRSRLIEETDSSTDDDEKQKHHSIFEVVVDHVSMYDKVKSRSNRACKNVESKQQQEEIIHRQDKIKQSLQQLKKSRAKREEREKRTSIDDRKSFQNTSEDDSHHERDSSHDFENEAKQQNPPRGSLSIITGLCSSSSDEDEKPTIPLKPKPQRMSKTKSKSSREVHSKIEKNNLKRKSSKASPLRSSAFFLNRSDDDSGPSLKKRKISSKHKVPSLTVLSSVDKSTSDESLSEPESVTLPTARPKGKPSLKSRKPFTKSEKKTALDIYTESDNSIQSFKDLHKASASSNKNKKDESSKQKSIRHIFESSESSGDERKGSDFVLPRIEKEGSVKVKASPLLPKESKNKKKVPHHAHESSGKTKKRKRDRQNSGETKSVTSSGDGNLSKKIQSTMDDLFGPMSNSGSEVDEPKKAPNHSLIEMLPTAKLPPPSKSKHEESLPSVSEFKKSKSTKSKNKQKRSSSFNESGKSFDEPSPMINSSSAENYGQHSKANSEKRKKKHHKKSKRLEGRDSLSSHKTEHSLDIDSLFSTPVSSPVTKNEIQVPVPVCSPTKLHVFSTHTPELPSMLNIQENTSPAHRMIEEEKAGKSMFSSDEDDDDKLKIDISEAIISASGDNEDEDEPMKRVELFEPLHEPIVDEAAAAAAKLLEEEEKRRNSLVEQDKAIESILMERKTPPRTVAGVIGSLSQVQPQRDVETDPFVKEELKDDAAISQEETEDAVAALLKNLGNEDDAEVDEAIDKRPASPPTLRIIEEAPSPSLPFGEHQSNSMEKESNWFGTATKPLLERDIPKKTVEPQQTPPPVMIDDGCSSPPTKKKLTTEEASIQLGEVLELAKQAVAESKKTEEALSVHVRDQSLENSHGRNRGGSNETAFPEVQSEPSSGDVYDFHDSDEETVHPPPPPVPSSTSSISPTTLPLAFPPRLESKGSTPPRTKSPASSGLLELTIEKLHVAQPQSRSQFSPKSRLPPPTPLLPHHVHLPPISVEVQSAAEGQLTQSNSSAEVKLEKLSPSTKIVESRKIQNEKENPSKGSVMPSQIVPTVPILPLVTPLRTSPTASAVSRSTVDETIEDVIRNFKVSDISESRPLYTQPPYRPCPRAVPKGKGRSASKDLDDHPPPTIGKGRVTSPTRRNQASNHAVTSENKHHNIAVQKTPSIPVIETRTDSQGLPQAEAFLIDPQTGLLTQMSGQPDDGHYIPISGHEAGKGQLLQIQSHPNHAYQPRPGQQSKAELERAGSLERIAPEQQPYQIQIQKNEGLPAILAQQQQHQILQHQVAENHRKQQQGSPTLTPPGKSGFGSTGASPPVSSPSFPFGQTKAPTVQSPPATMAGRPQGIYALPTSQATYAPVALIRPQQEPRPIRHHVPLNQHSPSPAQIQAQLVRIPQVPTATTITKVDSRNEEIQNRKGNLSQPPSTIILTTTGSGGPMGIPSGMRMPIQQHIQTRAHEGFSTQGPPRIEISGNISQAASGSPNGSRPTQHDPNQPHRLHHISFDSNIDDDSTSPAPLDLATPSSHNHTRANNNNTLAKNLCNNNNSVSSPSPPSSLHVARQGETRLAGRGAGLDPQYLSGLPHPASQYLGYIPGGNTLPPAQHNYGIRPGSVDPLKQTTEIPKQHERPSTAHIVPQHLSSPHLGERGSAESPHLVPIYGSRHPIYGTNGHLGLTQPHHSPIPSAHQHQRQTFTHPFEFEEGRIYSRSPGYPIQLHENRDRERDGAQAGREGSPFVVAPHQARRPGETPPPAHGMARYPQHQVLPPPQSSPTTDCQRLVQAQTPPHGMHGPQGDLLLNLLQRYPIVWQGLLALKNENAVCQFHFVSGNMRVASESLPTNPDGTTLPLRISQRMRLETTQLDGVARKLQTEQEHCMLLALPCGREYVDVLQQSNNLRSGFITYLQLKQAAGIVNVHQASGETPSFVIHIFPACDFANENLAQIAPDLLHGVADVAHLLIIIATV